MKNTPPKNKPLDALEAKEMFVENTARFTDALWDFMESKGYKWSREENLWVDDGSLESEWADRWNDERKGN